MSKHKFEDFTQVKKLQGGSMRKTCLVQLVATGVLFVMKQLDYYIDEDKTIVDTEISQMHFRNLPNTDVIGKTDPYVLIRMGMDEKQTSFALNCNDYDYLNEKYEMEYDPVKIKGKKEVDIEVWDYDLEGYDDLIGNASVDILPYLNKQTLVDLFLQPKKELRDPKHPVTKLSEKVDQKLGKVSFWLLYIPEQEY
ncbi:MAG: hypothetical protein EZS28_015997, partial [Streblomastix strix]